MAIYENKRLVIDEGPDGWVCVALSDDEVTKTDLITQFITVDDCKVLAEKLTKYVEEERLKNHVKTYSAKELADIFYLNAETVRRWARQGLIKPYEYNSKKEGMKFTHDEVVRFVEANQHEKYKQLFEMYLIITNDK